MLNLWKIFYIIYRFPVVPAPNPRRPLVDLSPYPIRPLVDPSPFDAIYRIELIQ